MIAQQINHGVLGNVIRNKTKFNYGKVIMFSICVLACCYQGTELNCLPQQLDDLKSFLEAANLLGMDA